MKVSTTPVRDVLLIEPTVFSDARGQFAETWNARRFAEAGIDAAFVQDNHSRSVRGALRGLHYQTERPQGKLVRVVHGEIFDVALDLRSSSPTFGRWVGTTLSAENGHELWIPPGFAHGFYVVSEDADVVYKCTDYYSPAHERTICWDDPTCAIAWPLVEGGPPLLSEKDRAGLSFVDAPAYP